MTYKVSVQYGQGRENYFTENFNNANLARDFIKEKMAENTLLRNTIYRLYEFDDLIETFDAEKMETTPKDNHEAQGRGQGSGFQPTPFNTSPKPAGMPHNWNKEGPDKEKKE